MNRTDAIRSLRSQTLRTEQFNCSTPYPFHVQVRRECGGIYSYLSYHPSQSRLRLNARQLLSFIRRNFPR